LTGSLASSFAAIAVALFLTELTDKDALLLLFLSTKLRPAVVFAAGAVAFAFTTTIIVSVGAFLVLAVPIAWIRLAGGAVMLAYGVWEGRGYLGLRAVEEQEAKVVGNVTGWRAFFAMVGALVLLDLAGDATEVLTIVFVAQYSDVLLVFAGALTGLVAATAVETALGSRLRGLLTPERLRFLSMAVFIVLGLVIIVSSL
jgi:putative Ca2+/H+ antiporter (TMEM165/GDT1 family)